MKRYLHDVILWIFLGCFMIVLMIAFLSADFGFIGLLEQNKWLWAIASFGLLICFYLLSSFYVTRWIEGLFKSYLESDLIYLVYPLSMPIILMLVIGFGVFHYFAFACAAITGLFLVRSYHWIQKKRSVMESNLLRYRLFVRYLIFLVLISLIFYVSLSF
ncbi:MAG TPA: hypothetical protein PLP48_05955 [Acholeplasmataceae bacterium]|nr:hypothetical protein [Acholeplasmataceae bacterium]